MAVVKEDLIVNSLIGEGTKFRGDFELNGLLRIDGGFEGIVESDGKVLVGRHGHATSDKIKARIVIIGGTVIGNIIASEQVTILSSGVIEGNITTPRLIAEEGVTLNGRVKITNDGHLSKHNDEQELEEARKEIG